MSDETLKDKLQILQTGMSLLGDLQAASANAIKLAKNSLEGKDPKVLVSSGPDVAIVKLGLECLDYGRKGCESAVRLSAQMLQLKIEIENDYADRGEQSGGS